MHPEVKSIIPCSKLTDALTFRSIQRIVVSLAAVSWVTWPRQQAVSILVQARLQISNFHPAHAQKHVMTGAMWTLENCLNIITSILRPIQRTLRIHGVRVKVTSSRECC
jgi:hypothetical protein